MKRFHALIFDFSIILSVLMAVLLISCRSTKTATEDNQQTTVQKSEKQASIFDQLQMFSTLSFDSLIISMKPGFHSPRPTKDFLPDSMQMFLYTADNDSTFADSLDFNRHPPESLVSSSRRTETANAVLPGTAEIKLYGLRKSDKQTDTKAVEVQQADSTANSGKSVVIKQSQPKQNLFLFSYILGAILSALIALLLWLLLRSSGKA